MVTCYMVRTLTTCEYLSSTTKSAAAALKRKASSDLDGAQPTTRTRTQPPSASPPLPLSYGNGAIRITRTPGRADANNCVNLRDVIRTEHLEAACVYSFFIAEQELYSFLPFSHQPGGIPIYIGRDSNYDAYKTKARAIAGLEHQEKISRKQLDSLRPLLQQLHVQRYGQNIHTFYAWAPGSCHSNLLLVYPAFLRIVITSCNMMDIDTELGDNHWYIHDVPKRASPATLVSAGFEADLLRHMEALGTPEAFLDSIRGAYDYSTVKVHLVTSVPGVCSGAKAEQHGLLRLRRVVQQMDSSLPEKDQSGELQLEVCTASIGNLNAKWLNGFNDCALGIDILGSHDENRNVPELKLFYPTMQDVKNADEAAQDGAANIGCHTRPWETAPVEVKGLFHHYQSKDCGKLFHQKFILAYNPRDTTQLPYYVYVGSANLSQSAWGALQHDKRGNQSTSDRKLIKMTNFECGVEGIVPHNQNAPPYDLAQDEVWNDYRWTADYRNNL
ncbi:tyrosyl-DNA phosphodiesterase I [Astrocystis sublimbata]|nr:tyrosyl-DNA phosphodiesterase I [Astrocystis sublimbata]